jgi:hypothetical protein
MAAMAYIDLQNSVAARAARASAAKPVPPQPAPPKPGAAPSELQRLIDAAQPGATVTVPKGTHTVPVQITRPLTLKGSSRRLSWGDDNGTLHRPRRQGGSRWGLTIKWQLPSDKRSNGLSPVIKDAILDYNCRFIPWATPSNAGGDPDRGFSKATVSDCRFEGFDYVVNYAPGTEGLVEGCVLRDGGHQGITGYDRSTLRVERTIVAGFRYHGLRCTGGTLHAKDNVLMDNRVLAWGIRTGGDRYQ